MSQKRKKGSGRKPGDGVLKNIDPDSHVSEKMRLLTYGRAYDKRNEDIYTAVGWFRYLRQVEDYAENGEYAPLKTLDQEFLRSVNDNKLREKLFRRLTMEMGMALNDFNPDWFQAMADAIRAANSGEKLYPIHRWLLSASVNHPRQTIRQLCEQLEALGFRAPALSNNAWQVNVRRACNEIGYAFLPDKPGHRRRK